MNVQLISTTKGAHPDLADGTPEEIIIYLARVSSNRQNKREDYAKLIRYLIDHKHWSPFEMASMCVEIVTSRAIAQQILRHRSFSFQEFSQRYAKMLYMEPIELRRQATQNRQSSTETVDDDLLVEQAEEAVRQCQQVYQRLLQAGVAKECARFVLPLTTQTRLYMQGTVRSWIHYLQIRDEVHVQLEHRHIAQAIKGIFVEQYPETSKALGWHVQ